MAITNIKGQKPLPITEVDTLDQVLSKQFANATENRKLLVSSIIDIVRQYATNLRLETDERNVKIVDTILLRHEALLQKILTDSKTIDAIIATLDLQIPTVLQTDYVLLDKKYDVKQIKKDIVQFVLDAFEKYSVAVQTQTPIVKEKIVVQTKTEVVEKPVEVKTNVLVKDETVNVDNMSIVEVYVKNIQSFMRDLYKSKLKQNIDTKVSAQIQKKPSATTKVAAGVVSANIISNNTKIHSVKTSRFGLRDNLTSYKNRITGIFNKLKINKEEKLSRKARKSLNPFRDINLQKRITGINTSLFKKNFKKFIDKIKNSVVGQFLKRIIDKVMKTFKPIINKIKSFINKVKQKIIDFVIGLIPFVGIVYKILKFVLVPAIKLLLFTFKVFKTAIQLITFSIFKLFAGATALIKGITKGAFAVIKGITAGIKKILNSNIIKKLIKFILTPTGMFVTGFVIGLFYVKCWKPLSDFFNGVKDWFKDKFSTDDGPSLSERIENTKNFVLEKYEHYKEKLMPYIQMAMDFLSTIDRCSLQKEWAIFNVNYIIPLKELWKTLKALGASVVGNIIGGGIGAVIGKTIGAALSCAGAGPIGEIVGGLVGAAIGWFLGSNDTGFDERDEWNIKRNNFKTIYGTSRSTNQRSVDELKNLINENGTSNLSDSVKAKIRAKQRAQRDLGFLSSEELDNVEALRTQVKEEINALPKDKLKYDLKEIRANKDGKHADAYQTKIPFPSEVGPDGQPASYANDLLIPDWINPYGFRLIRAKLLNDKIDAFDNRTITYDQLMEFKDNIVSKDENGNFVIDQNLINEESTATKHNLMSVLHNDDSRTGMSVADNDLEDFYDIMVSSDDASRQQDDAKWRRERAEEILNLISPKAIKNNLIRRMKEETNADDSDGSVTNKVEELWRSTLYTGFKEYLSRLPWSELDKILDKDGRTNQKVLTSLCNKFVSMAMDLQFDEIQAISDESQEPDPSEETKAAIAAAEAERAEAEEALKRREQVGEDAFLDSIEEATNTDTIQSISQQQSPVAAIQQSDQQTQSEMSDNMNKIESESSASIQSIAKEQTKDMVQTDADINNTLTIIDKRLDEIKEKQEHNNVVDLSQHAKKNNALEEVKQLQSSVDW